MFDVTRRGPVAVLRLAHGKASALDLEFCRALTATLEALPASGARALVLTGTGTIFSAGVDLKRLLDGGAAYVTEFLPAMDAAFRALWLLLLPTVAAVNGHAIAGGGVLTLACDRRLMAEGTGKIGVPELKVGVPFPALPFEIVRSALAAPAAAEAILAAATYTPADARGHGWLDEVVPPPALLDRAVAIAEALAAIPAATYALTKRQLRAPALARLAAAAPIDAEVTAAWRTPAVLDAVRAYVEKTLKR